MRGLWCVRLFILLSVFVSGFGFGFSSKGGRVGHVDARPCLARVHIVCGPASALRCVVPGPLGDALGSVSLVVVSMVVCFIYVNVFMR